MKNTDETMIDYEQLNRFQKRARCIRAKAFVDGVKWLFNRLVGQCSRNRQAVSYLCPCYK